MKKTSTILLCVITTVLFITGVMLCDLSRTTSTTVSKGGVLIDAGHGGVDGGTSTVNGMLEKDINLKIAHKLYDILTVFGIQTNMTRETDVSIHDSSCETIREKKVSDMANRLKLYNEATLTVSIHQNHFSATKYRGTQVFYSPSHPMSRSLAESVSKRVVMSLQPDNTRKIKQTTKDMYLFHHTEKPAILVECGFLSNPQDSEALQSEIYQQQMASVIAVGVLDVFGTKE